MLSLGPTIVPGAAFILVEVGEYFDVFPDGLLPHDGGAQHGLQLQLEYVDVLESDPIGFVPTKHRVISETKHINETGLRKASGARFSSRKIPQKIPTTTLLDFVKNFPALNTSR